MAFTARTETYADTSGASSLTVNVPSGTQDGDILFLFVACVSYAPNSGLDDWTAIANTTNFFLYRRIASSEPASYTIGFAGSTKARIMMSCYPGGDFDASDPIDVVSNTNYTTNNATVRAAAMTVSAPNSPMVFFGGGYYTSAAMTFTKPGDIGSDSWTEDDDAGSSNSDIYMTVCSMIRSSAGSTGTMDATASNSVTGKHAFAVALNPAPDAGATVFPGLLQHHYIPAFLRR